MKNASTILLIVAVGLLAFLLYSQNSALRQERQRIQELNEKVESLSKKNDLDAQEKCARQSREAFKRDGWEKEKGALFSNHYNEKLNRCFMQVDNTDTKPEFPVVSKVVSDAFEGKVYATYMWRADKVKKFWEVPPFMCTVTLPSGEDKDCHSSDEFDALVKAYLE
jgi:TolA-binding protein